jgi:hypothetical protein
MFWRGAMYVCIHLPLLSHTNTHIWICIYTAGFLFIVMWFISCGRSGGLYLLKDLEGISTLQVDLSPNNESKKKLQKAHSRKQQKSKKKSKKKSIEKTPSASVSKCEVGIVTPFSQRDSKQSVVTQPFPGVKVVKEDESDSNSLAVELDDKASTKKGTRRRSARVRQKS